MNGWSMPDWLRHRASTSPNHLALRAGSEHLSFHDLDRRADRAARQLAARGVVPGSRVALLLRGGVSFAVLTHALARLGAILVPLNARLLPVEWSWQLADSRASLLIHDEASAAEALEAAEGLPGVDCVAVEALSACAETDAQLRYRIAPADAQGIIYTSATSGRPKGVVLTFGNHWWSAVGSALNLGVHRDDCWLAPLPLYHVGGLAILWRSVICGIPAVIHDAFDPDTVNREIDSGRVTLISVVSTMLQRMLDARGPTPYPPRLRCVLLGGGPAPAALIDTCLHRGVPVAPTYGLTETASQVATLVPDDVARKPGSVGTALVPGEVCVEAAGRPATVGEVGEILIRGPTVTPGYADRPDETARAIRDGWLHTGDLGYLDDEGCLYVVDRRDDLIISGGENVYPAEVEAALLAHPGIDDAGVIGFPDPVWGQTVAAAVTLKAGAHVSADALKAFCAGRLAAYKVPRQMWFVDELPRSASGKVLRRVIRERVPSLPGRQRA